MYGGNGSSVEDIETPKRSHADTSMWPCTSISKDVARKSAAAALSGLMLFAAFPPLEYSFLAWIALIPLFWAITESAPGEAFACGFIAGASFWLPSIFWLTRVTFIGWFGISLYCALYTAFFSMAAAWFFMLRSRRPGDASGGLSVLLGFPALWVALEYARAHLMTGFPWNQLGISQHGNLALIQCADLGGVYAVSFLVAMGNTAALMLLRESRRLALRPMVPILCFILLLAAALVYGRHRIAVMGPNGSSVQIVSVQPNVPQQLKWSQDWAAEIYERLRHSSDEACRRRKPDLLVWPETALPDFLQSSAQSREVVEQVRSHGAPLLAGSMHFEEMPGKSNYYNSSFLFLPGRDAPLVYAKRHLVPFGEYVPLGNLFPFLRSIAGVYEDFVPGHEVVVFDLSGCGKFSALICFEDIFPYLARDCVRAGARLLVNQTNDAWFDPLRASRQHMTHCVFRCVENRVACLRSANTGLTCHIDRRGKVGASIPPVQAKPEDPRVMFAEVAFAPDDMPLTFYTRRGDLIALACLAFSLSLFAGMLLHRARKVK